MKGVSSGNIESIFVEIDIRGSRGLLTVGNHFDKKMSQLSFHHDITAEFERNIGFIIGRFNSRLVQGVGRR